MKELLGRATKIEIIKKSKKKIGIPKILKENERIKLRRKSYVLKRKL